MNEIHDEGMDPRDLAVLVLGQLRHGVKTRPAATLAGIFGVGFVLGRALPGFVSRMAAGLAVRAMTEQVIVRSLGGSSR